MSQNSENIDILLTSPVNYIKNIQSKSQQIISISPQHMWQLMLQIRDVLQIQNNKLLPTLLALRFIKDTLLLGSYNFYILSSIHTLPSIATISQIQSTDNVQKKAKELILRRTTIEQKQLKAEEIGIAKSIILICEQILCWFQKVIPEHPFAKDHKFKSHFHTYCDQLQAKNNLSSFTFFKEDDAANCSTNYKRKGSHIEQQTISMKEYIKGLLQIKTKANLQKLVLLLRSGDSHIINYTYEHLHQSIKHSEEGKPPFQTYHTLEQLCKCGQVQFITLVKIFITPEIIKYIFNFQGSSLFTKTNSNQKRQLLQIINTFNQVALKYKIDNDVFHTTLIKTKYWSTNQSQLKDFQENNILKQINHYKNNSVEFKYTETASSLIQKIKEAQFNQISANYEKEEANSIKPNQSYFSNQPSPIGSQLQSRLRSKLKRKQKLKNKESSIPEFPAQVSNISQKDIFETNKIENNRISQYYSPSIKTKENEIIKQNKQQNKLKKIKSLSNLAQDYSFKEKELLQLQSREKESQIKRKEPIKISRIKVSNDKPTFEQKKQNLKIIHLEKRVEVKVEATIRKPPFGFKNDNFKTMQSQNYIDSDSVSESISISVEEKSIKGNDCSYSNFSEILNTNQPDKDIRVLENEYMKGYAINPYKNREKQLNKKKQQLQKNNVEYENMIKDKDEKIERIKEKIEKEKEKFTTYQTTLGKAYENINQNIDSLLLSSNHYEKPLNFKYQEQLRPLKRVYNDLFEPIPKKITKQIMYKKCLLLKNTDIEIGFVNNQEKQNIVLYYTFHRSFDSTHIYIQNAQSTGFILSQQFDAQIKNIPKNKNIKMEIKIFDYDESLNPDSKMKLMSLVTRLKNQSKSYLEEEEIKEYKVQLPYCLYGNFVKFNNANPSSSYRPSFVSNWEQCCEEFYKNKKEYLEMILKGGFWSQQSVYRIECTYKGKVYKMAILIDHRSFCIQGEGKGNPHLASVIGSLLIK